MKQLDFVQEADVVIIWVFSLLAHDVFAYLNHRRYANLDLSAYVSFFEIYNGKVGRHEGNSLHSEDIYWIHIFN